MEEMKKRVQRNLATEQLVKQEVDSKISVSDSEISDYYAKNKDRMRRSESVKLSEIFVRADPKATADVKAKARQRIEALLKELQGGKDFAALARQFSESPDAKDGGNMGYVSRNGTLPVLAEAAFRLKVGEISDVVESPFGYHLLKVTDKKPAGDVTLAEAKTQISNFLYQQKEREAFNAYLGKLKAGAKIEILTPTP
jgi:peptidyl-prolyl cis-trans isomerase C